LKPRHHLYLDKDLTRRLDELGAKPGTSKSAIMSDALRAYLGRRGANELDDLLKVRLDRMGKFLNRIARDQQVILESLALFIRYQFTITAPLPESDHQARAIGQDRFQAFVDQVGRKIASGPSVNQDMNLLDTDEGAK
jgi:predicted transcriptional regulator